MKRLPLTIFRRTLLVCVVAAAVQQSGWSQQISISRVEQMPNMPAPYLMRDWKQTALGYDSLVYDLFRTGDYLPLVYLNTATVNYPGQTSLALIPMWVQSGLKAARQSTSSLRWLVQHSAASTKHQNGYNWALMCQEYFNTGRKRMST